VGDGVASITQLILFVIHLVEFIKDVDSDTSKSYLKRVTFSPVALRTEKVDLFTQVVRFHYSIHMSLSY
jgi:hypothetical protein